MSFSRRLGAWFGWRGRLRRRNYWAMAFAASAVFVVLYVSIETLVGRGATLALYPPFFACHLALAARRLHDQARGAGWLLLVAVPVLGPLVVAAWLLLKGGTPGENQYGPDPRVAGRDYLVVDAYGPG